MKQIVQSVVIIASILSGLSSVLAQQAPEKRPLIFYERLERDMFGMLGRTVIQEELEISISQYERYVQASKASQQSDPYYKMNRDEQHKKWPEWIDRLNKLAEKILEPEQFQRLQQIQLQQRGVVIFQDPEIAAKLKVTEKQMDEIYPVLIELAEQVTRYLPEPAANGEVRDEWVKQRADAHKTAREKIDAVLTNEQKQQWSEMLGPEFKKQIWGKPVYVD